MGSLTTAFAGLLDSCRRRGSREDYRFLQPQPPRARGLRGCKTGCTPGSQAVAKRSKALSSQACALPPGYAILKVPSLFLCVILGVPSLHLCDPGDSMAPTSPFPSLHTQDKTVPGHARAWLRINLLSKVRESRHPLPQSTESQTCRVPSVP